MFEGGRYAASTASTTSGSGRRGGGAGERRARVVRLVRPRRAAPAFGFSLRGGREHAAGFFVTKVEHNSEAQRQGLKMGDQVMSVNGYRVEDAVHSELTHYIANQTRLKIKVRNVGMIPVKEKGHEPLTWKFVSDTCSITSDTTASSSPTLCESERLKDMHLSILVPPKAKLGCGICKGPDWKPGIFVQFVKEHGIARDSGLRAGDQILSCNGIDFTSIQFNEAISTMKQFGRLELRVRPGAGAELVSPESSGYNSSASSAAGGDHSPHAPDKRLSIVTEETADFKDRLIMNRLKRRTWDSLDFDWRAGLSHSFDAPSDIEPDYDSPSIPNNPHSFENQKNLLRKKEFVTAPSNKTIINLTENGATIQCSYDHRSVNKTVSDTTQSRRNGESEKKTIVVEVHHNQSKLSASSNTTAAVVSRDQCSETSSLSSNTTLSSAIAEEIMRRKLKQSTEERPASTVLQPPPAVRKSALLKPGDSDAQRQHDALMDEFKKLHRKMFSALDEPPTPPDQVDRQQTLPLRKSAPASNSNDDVITSTAPKASVQKPPPPPPMPLPENGNHKAITQQNGYNNKANVVNGINEKPHMLKTKVLNGVSEKPQAINGKIMLNGTLKRTPTPDYESPNIEAITAKLNLKTHIEETAEVDSIESYKMKNPPSPQPKPPSNYFMRSPNGTATMKKTGRPVSITIGEYPSRTLRKEPSKLEFLNGESKTNGELGRDEVPISSRLHSELAMTLSRSNLRKKTEPLNKLETNGKQYLDNNSDESDQADKNFLKRYGNNILPTPPLVSIPKISIVKTNSHPISQTIAKTNCHPISQHIASLACKVSDGRKDGTLKEAVLKQENRKKISFDQTTMMAIGDYHSVNGKSS